MILDEHGHLKIETQIDSLDGLNAFFYDSYFYLNDSLWAFNDSNKIGWRGKEIRFDNLLVGNANQEILLDGILSERRADSLRMDLQEFNLGYLSTFHRFR